MVIELTKEQAKAYLAGNKIELIKEEPLWTPKGGNYYIDGSGDIKSRSSWAPSARYGVEFSTEELAKAYLPKYKKHNLILNWLSEQEDQSEGSTLVQHNGDAWVTDSFYGFHDLGTIMMNDANASKLCDLLNDGTVSFDEE